MIRRSLYFASAWLRCKTIRGDSASPYLERYFVCEAFGHRVYLHRFLGGDAEEAVHDHPWQRAKALVLVGKYEEHRTELEPTIREYRVVRRAGRFNRLQGDSLHRIAKTEPETWTLFWHTSEKIKPWGFLQLDEQGQPYIQPHQSSHQPDWEKREPRGRDVPDRAPYLARHKVPQALRID